MKVTYFINSKFEQVKKFSHSIERHRGIVSQEAKSAQWARRREKRKKEESSEVTLELEVGGWKAFARSPVTWININHKEREREYYFHMRRGFFRVRRRSWTGASNPIRAVKDSPIPDERWMRESPRVTQEEDAWPGTRKTNATMARIFHNYTNCTLLDQQIWCNLPMRSFFWIGLEAFDLEFERNSWVREMWRFSGLCEWIFLVPRNTTKYFESIWVNSAANSHVQSFP